MNEVTNPLDVLQQRFGTVDYSAWQTIRQPYWSNVLYPAAGSNRITFFGNAIGQQNMQLTNMPKAGSFGQQHYLLKSLRFTFYIAAINFTWGATDADADTFAADLMTGFFQGGVLEMNIGAKQYIQMNKPFLTMPQGMGRLETYGAGFTAGAPASTSAPWVTPLPGSICSYVVDPQIFIAAEQQFEMAISYPSGLIPIIATNVFNAGTNPLYVQCMMDGIVYRPVQ